MCIKQYAFAVFSENMMDLCGPAADTLCFLPHCDMNFMVPIEDRSQIHLSPVVKRYRIKKKLKKEVSSAFVKNENGRKDELKSHQMGISQYLTT